MLMMESAPLVNRLDFGTRLCEGVGCGDRVGGGVTQAFSTGESGVFALVHFEMPVLGVV